MDEVVVSAGGGTSLRVERGRWTLTSARGSKPIETAMYALLPLLEGDPDEVVAGIARMGGPDFPFEELLVTALSSESGYWQEQAVPWLAALNPPRSEAMTQAARTAIEGKMAAQRARQQIRRWLSGKPVYRD